MTPRKPPASEIRALREDIRALMIAELEAEVYALRARKPGIDPLAKVALDNDWRRVFEARQRRKIA